MTTSGVIGAAAVILAFGGAAFLLAPVVRRRRLGVLHPAVAWLALEGVFFGVGSIALALADGRSGPGLFLAGCVIATAVAVRLAHRVGPFAAGPLSPPDPPDPPDRPEPEPGARRWVPVLLAAASLGVIAPTLLETGLPLFSSDATVARTALVGIPIQFVRVAVPALAAVLLLETLSGHPAFGRRAVAWAAICALVVLMLSLASRYLVVELLAGLVLAWLLTGRPIPVPAAVAIVVIGLVGFVVIGVVRAPQDFESDPGAIAGQRTISRLFLVQPRTLDALQVTIPAQEPYFLGLTWFRRIGPLVGRDDIPNLGYWIYPKVVEGPQAVAGYAALGLIGEAWANFGPAGIGIFVVLGVALEAMAAWIAVHRARVVDIAAGSLAVLFVARTHALGLLGLALLLALVVGWRLLAGARMHRTEVRPDETG